MLYDKKWDAKKIEAPAQLEPWRKLLLDAAVEVERRGHCKEVPVNERGEVCLYGGLRAVVSGKPNGPMNNLARQAAAAVSAHLLLRSYGMDLVHWNNAPERTASEVIAALRGAASQP